MKSFVMHITWLQARSCVWVCAVYRCVGCRVLCFALRCTTTLNLIRPILAVQLCTQTVTHDVAICAFTRADEATYILLCFHRTRCGWHSHAHKHSLTSTHALAVYVTIYLFECHLHTPAMHLALLVKCVYVCVRPCICYRFRYSSMYSYAYTIQTG